MYLSHVEIGKLHILLYMKTNEFRIGKNIMSINLDLVAPMGNHPRTDGWLGTFGNCLVRLRVFVGKFRTYRNSLKNTEK